MSDVEKPLEEIMEKESDAENTVESNKKKADHANAVEMRKRAIESIRSTQKRKGGDEVEDEENAQPKPKITMKSGGETMAYLREKNDMAQKWKAEELELQKQRLEVEARRVPKATSRNDANDGPASQAATESNAAVSADLCCYATTAVTNHFKAFRKTKPSNLNMLRVVERTTTGFIASLFIQIKRPFDHIFV